MIFKLSFFSVELRELFIYVGYQYLISHIICKYFLLFNKLSFCFVYGFLCYAKAFKFNQVPLVYICFYFHSSRRWVIEDLALIYDIDCSVYISSKVFIVSNLTFRSLIHFEFFLCMVLENVLISFFQV